MVIQSDLLNLNTMDELINTEPILSTKYAELPDLESYTALNTAISDAKQYPRDSTNIYAPEEVEPVNGLYYMEIGAHLQETWPETLTGIVLVERIPEVILEEPV